MAGKKKILFIKNISQNPKFILNDFDILKKEYAVTLKNFKNRKNALIIFSLLSQLFYLALNIWKFDLIYIWFADYLSFLPVMFTKLTGKKSIICAGGYESTYIPEINMGVFTNATISKSIRSFCVKYSLKNCTIILPVDETLIENTNNYIYSDIPGKLPLKDGIKEFIPDIKDIFKTIYLGYDPQTFRKPEKTIKENSVVSAGLIVNNDEFQRKGFDLLIEAAKHLSNINFVLIGFNEEMKAKYADKVTPNVILYGIVPYSKLIEEYSKAKIYAQFSMFEGMPSSICEAMLCECIPVGSMVNGIPKIINSYGQVINKRDAEEVKKAINDAMNMPDEYGVKAREHIKNLFPLIKREQEILKLVKNLIN